MFKHILIPTDGSAAANKAAKAGIALARRLGAKVTAYCAPEEAQPTYVEGYSLNQAEIDGFDERAREAGQKCADDTGGGVPLNQGWRQHGEVTVHAPEESFTGAQAGIQQPDKKLGRHASCAVFSLRLVLPRKQCAWYLALPFSMGQ